MRFNDWFTIKDGQQGIVITDLSKEFVLKELYNRLKTERRLLLKSTNREYKMYDINVSDISEIWKFKGYIHLEWPEYPNIFAALEKIEEGLTLLKKS